ncbi:hypothetical protein ACFVR1_04970 [Psychrobacillus sp. NPDC058041]|uniref:hypothetical protein n=1 Tax=Psychrobacillus sp. NPDC058041 TaxID=3346310 RepID=UPI0036D9DC3D
MKKYIVFMLSFALLLLVFQLLSGWLLTVSYTPDLFLQKTTSDPTTVLGQSSTIYLVGILFIASLAYFTSQKLSKTE